MQMVWKLNGRVLGTEDQYTVKAVWQFFRLPSFTSSLRETSSNRMLYVLMGVAALGLAQEEFRPLNARANSTEPLDSLLLPRELTGRQQYCDAGYGLCGKFEKSSISTAA